MSWDMRRLAMAIENAAMVLAATALVITGHWAIATVAVAWKIFDNLMLAYDWTKQGQPRQ